MAQRGRSDGARGAALSNSPAVEQERFERTLTQQKTEEIRAHLEEEVAREEEQASATEVREDALKQYAKLEEKLDRASNRLETKKDERLLS